ncbi:hypothetical protein D1872_299220 [compost metagenome]
MHFNIGLTIHDLGAFRSNAESAYFAAGVFNDQLLVRVVPSDGTFNKRPEDAGRNINFIAALNYIDIFSAKRNTVNTKG